MNRAESEPNDRSQRLVTGKSEEPEVSTDADEEKPGRPLLSILEEYTGHSTTPAGNKVYKLYGYGPAVIDASGWGKRDKNNKDETTK
jgi:hypothetical protein